MGYFLGYRFFRINKGFFNSTPSISNPVTQKKSITYIEKF